MVFAKGYGVSVGEEGSEGDGIAIRYSSLKGSEFLVSICRMESPFWPIRGESGLCYE